MPNCVTIFLTAESEDELVRRLQERKTEAADQLKMRIVTARRELKRVREFDYVVVNRDGALDEAVDQVLSIIAPKNAGSTGHRWKSYEGAMTPAGPCNLARHPPAIFAGASAQRPQFYIKMAPPHVSRILLVVLLVVFVGEVMLRHLALPQRGSRSPGPILRRGAGR